MHPSTALMKSGTASLDPGSPYRGPNANYERFLLPNRIPERLTPYWGVVRSTKDTILIHWLTAHNRQRLVATLSATAVPASFSRLHFVRSCSSTTLENFATAEARMLQLNILLYSVTKLCCNKPSIERRLREGIKLWPFVRPSKPSEWESRAGPRDKYGPDGTLRKLELPPEVTILYRSQGTIDNKFQSKGVIE